MKPFVFTGLVGIAILLCVLFPYADIFGRFPLSNEVKDWASFGDYFGGVSGPLFSFLGALLIVYTIRQQSVQISSLEREAQKTDILRYVSKSEEEIDRLMSRKINFHGKEGIEFGDIVHGFVDIPPVISKPFEIAAERLLKLVCAYCAALALYEENLDSHFIFQAHRQKALDILSFLERNTKHLNSMAVVSLGLCRGHLEGSLN